MGAALEEGELLNLKPYITNLAGCSESSLYPRWMVLSCQD